MPQLLFGPKLLITALLAGSLAGTAQAQATFSIGPKTGCSLSSASFRIADYPDYFSTAST